MKKIAILAIVISLLFACDKKDSISDAYGNFTAKEIIISAETNGKIMEISKNKGEEVTQGFQLAMLDTTQLSLQKKSLNFQTETILSQKQEIESQIEVLTSERENLLTEQKRIDKLLRDKAIPQKSKDDIDGKMVVMNKRIKSVRDKVSTLNKQLEAQKVQIEIITDKIERCKIKAPISAVILDNYHEIGEFVTVGRPLFKLAKTDKIILSAYVSGSQLSQIKLGQKVEVLTDAENGKIRTAEGKIVFIASKAEFTPKIVQTREQRTSLVYNIEVEIENDGSYKIGMPGEVKW